eukprot:4909414-Pleurochrysis_carterae.AAC.1
MAQSFSGLTSCRLLIPSRTSITLLHILNSDGVWILPASCLRSFNAGAVRSTHLSTCELSSMLEHGVHDLPTTSVAAFILCTCELSSMPVHGVHDLPTTLVAASGKLVNLSTSFHTYLSHVRELRDAA